jgi:predicted HicB family RNase H-like nuclease
METSHLRRTIKQDSSGDLPVAIKTIVHKGYHGTIEVKSEDYSLHGSILFIDEKVRYSGQSFAELEDSFRQAVEAHRQACRERGQEPPFTEAV